MLASPSEGGAAIAIESDIDVQRRCARIWLRGDFTLDEILATIDRIVGDPRWQRGFAMLSDHTEIGEPLTPAQAEKMLEHVERLANGPMAGMRWAAVTRKAASYGMLRMVSVLARRIPIELQVFGSHAEAERWLFGDASSGDTETGG